MLARFSLVSLPKSRDARDEHWDKHHCIHSLVIMAPVIDDVAEDENYASSEDEDFVPDDAPAAAASASESESEAEAEGDSVKAGKGKPKAKRKRGKPVDEDAEDIGFENSGDEAIIGKGLKKQRRRQRKGEEEDDEGGEGGFVKTRRMAAAA